MITSASKEKDLTFYSTGLPQLDRILGGGIPVGRVSVFTGSYSVGKSTLAMFVIREAQKAGVKCLFIDDENSFLPNHAKMCGIDLEKLEIMRGAYMEEILDDLIAYIGKHKNRLIVLDSFRTLSPRDERENEIASSPPAVKARLMSKFFRKTRMELRENNNTLIIINHEYAQVMGVQAGQMVLAGGQTMNFEASLWVKLKYKSGKMLMRGDMRVGDVVVAHVQKNKTGGNRHAECEIKLEYNRGFVPETDHFQDALDKGEIRKVKTSYWLGDVKLAVGNLAARNAYQELQKI